MLPRRRRVSKRLFETALAAGTTKHGQFLYVKTVQNNEEGQFAVVVPKKVAKRSVDRHTYKRMLMGHLSSRGTQLPTGIWLIFYKPTSKNASKEQLTNDLSLLLAL